MEENEIACIWACLKCGKVFYDTENEFASRGRQCKECAEKIVKGHTLTEEVEHFLKRSAQKEEQ